MPLLPTENLAVTCLASSLPPGLLVGNWCGLSDFLICPDETAFAVCLSGAAKFRAFSGSGVNDAWRGYHVSNVSLIADLSSAFSRYERDPEPGDLVVRDGGIYIATRPNVFGGHAGLVRWGDGTSLNEGAITGGFSRWHVVFGEVPAQVTLLQIDSGEPSHE